jgi:hypothetical protein
MKKFIVALLATGLMGSALAQTPPPPAPPAPSTPPASQPVKVPGAKTATVQSLGDLTPFGVVLGVAAVGVIVAVSSGGGHSTSGTTGTH